MLKSKNHILVSIILLIFVGQVVASNSMSCTMLEKTNMSAEMMMETQLEMSHDMSSMNHAMHTSTGSGMSLGMSSDMSSGMPDCCSGDNHCNMSSCFSLALSNDIQLKAFYFPLIAIPFKFTMAPSQTISSLYRPPIFS